MIDSVTDTEIVMLDPEGHVLTWNEGARVLTGYTADEAVGRHVSMFYTSEDSARRLFDQELREATRTGRYAGEGWRIRKDGVPFWASVVVEPLRDADTGEPRAFVKLVRDLSDTREQDEHRLTSDLIVESAPNAMLLVDWSGVIQRVNSQVEALFGYSGRELVGRPVEILVPERFRGRHPGFRAQFFSDPHARAMGAGRELFGLTKDGREIPIEIGLNPIEIGDATLVIASIIDISSRRLQEMRLLTADLMVESAPNAMLLVDAGGRIQRVNAQAEDLFAYSRDDLVGRPVEVLVPERFRDDHSAFRGGFFHEPRRRAMGAGRDLFGLTSDGREIPIEIGLNPIETGEGTMVLASIIDITERRRAEEIVRRQRDEILELSTPVMQVWDRVLALPIIGTLDSNRTARLTENLLQRIAEDEASIVILDISGVPTFDTEVAQNLFRTIKGARLMGAESIISGVRPETAQAMVHLGIDIGTIRSRATLRDALQLALKLQREIDQGNRVG
jgi:PAS domain S-box-containing protein